ncbi:hypothetical protein JHK87_027231 [Glycine soja]|nr:hypothetical protein JHK87_027231 [Glycine soja]
MDSAIRSRTPPNLGTSPIHSFASIVDNTIRSRASSNFGSSPVHGFASVVDNVIRSGTASNFGTSPIHGFASMEEMRMWSSSQKSSSRRHKLWLSILVLSLRLLHWVSVSVSSTIEVEDEVLPREEASSARVLGDKDGVSGKRCSSASSCGRKVKGSSAGASGRRSRRFFCLIQRKNLLDLLLLEPAEEPF